MDITKQSLLLRGAEVAAELGISRALAYRWMKCGILPTLRQGKAVRVPRAALLAWIQQHTQEAA
jgi:excisionase family DNA binding protein